jgi:hypothetical protein
MVFRADLFLGDKRVSTVTFRSLLVTDPSQVDVDLFVPEGRLIIAQQFTAGGMGDLRGPESHRDD